MTNHNKIFALLSVFSVAVLCVAAAYLYTAIHSSNAGSTTAGLPTQAQWAAALASSSVPQIVGGTIVAVGNGHLTLVVDKFATFAGTTTVAYGTTTVVTSTTSKSPQEMQAAFEEFKKEQAAANGSPITPPNPSTVVVLKISDLKVGQTVLVTLTPDSKKGAFVAQSIQVLLLPPATIAK